MKKVIMIIMICLYFIPISYCQNDKADKNIEKAVQFIQQGNENKAINLLKETTIKYPSYAPTYIFLGEIFYNKNDYTQSIEYYKKGVELAPDFELDAYYKLAVMHKAKQDYTQSLKNFQYYIANQHSKRYSSRVEQCKKELKNLDFITSAMQNPVPFHPYSLGENINDASDQYLPTLTIDEQLYITQRENNKEDFYYCKKESEKDGIPVWGIKQKMPYPLNSDENEGAASISPDGKYLYFAKCNAKDGFGSCDIYRTKREGNAWSEPENLGENVNSSAWDSQPSIASDGRTLFFASNRDGGFGQSDIWYSYLKDDGTWTKAKNAGNTINTAGMEISPFIHPSNSVLYFASDSLIGMGGMDIYYSKIIDGKFQTPINIGYPINTDKNENCLVVSPNSEYAVYAKLNNENNMDLYAFNLYEAARPTSIICMKGIVKYDDNKTNNEALFEIRNLKTNRLIASTTSDRINNDYMLTLPIGEDYALSVTCDGYLLYSENFSLKQTNKQTKYLQKDILMKSIKEGKSIILHNIFFETASFELKQESFAELNSLKNLLLHNPNINIEIAGFTDNVGKDDYNLKLSQNRANSVKKWLVENGIEDNRMIAKGYGKTNPIADNNTEEGRQQNRRTEFKIIKAK